MKTLPSKCDRLWTLFLTVALVMLFLILPVGTCWSGSAAWKTVPTTGDWNTAANWSTGGPPNGPADVATFDTSTITGLSFSGTIEVNQIVFDPGASPYTFTSTFLGRLTLSGIGIRNNSGITQNFVTSGSGGEGAVTFSNSASAGSLTSFSNEGGTAGGAFGGFMTFNGTSSAGSGVFATKGGSVAGAFGGFIVFQQTSTAANGTYANDAGVTGAGGGFIQFFDTATAGNGIFTNNGGTSSGGGGLTQFFATSTAGAATLIANGGSGAASGGLIEFQLDSSGGTSRIEVFENASLDISAHSTTALTVGSIEGSGSVFLGANKLTVGTNNLTTTLSGIIQDGGINGGAGGSLTKAGAGTLILTNSNTYTGGTTVSSGTLLVQRSSGSSTGSGLVQVNGGTLAGSGRIAGAVSIGNNSGTRGYLAPGGAGTGTLSVQQNATFKADGTYNFQVNSNKATSDRLTARGVMINSGATFSASDLAASTLTAGTAFIVISNTGSAPISGAFNNLADGSTITIGSNSYSVNYEGGDGNDLVLTVQ
jgi:autotransporter-associated beta strand protein